MNIKTKVKVATLLTASVFTNVSAQEKNTIDPYFTDSERGWYWYEQLPEEEKEKFVEKLVTEQPTLIPIEKEQQPPAKEPVPLSNAWYRQNFEKYKDAAINNPYDQEAMRTYLYLEKFMVDRAEAFGYEREKAVLSDPFLDSTTKKPLANFGLRAMNVEASQIRDGILTELGKQSGLFFFYRSDDIYSAHQSPLVKALERNYGFTIKAVSMDGKALPNGEWPEFITDDGRAQSIGVYQVPAIYLFNPNKESFEMVTQGLQSLPDLRKRIIIAAERAELVTPEKAKLVRGSGLYQTTQGDISNGFPLPDHAPKAFKDFYLKSIEQE